MKSLIVLVVLVGLTYGKSQRTLVKSGLDPMSDEMIDAVNSLGTTWKVSDLFNRLFFDLF